MITSKILHIGIWLNVNCNTDVIGSTLWTVVCLLAIIGICYKYIYTIYY